jgi:hypothetical protein
MLKEGVVLPLLALLAAPLRAQGLSAAFSALAAQLEVQRREALSSADWELKAPAPRTDFGILGGAPQEGGNPYPGFNAYDTRLVRKAIDDGRAAARRRPECDHALVSYGVPSLLALLDRYIVTGPGAQIFDGRSSTLKPEGWKKNVSETFRSSDNTAGAFVLWGGGLNAPVTFLGPYFFSPTSIDWMDAQRMIIVMHESVHQFPQLLDSDFGGSKKLSHLIVEKCYPQGRGRLGGID